MKNNNNFRLKRTVTGVSCALLLLCNSSFSQDENPDNTFTLNLKNTDIHSLISTVSKQTGRNFVVDPRVKAKVTVISTDPVNADGLYEVFLSVLQVHGYSAVPAGDLIKIVPDVTAKQGPVPILGEGEDSTDQLVTQVIPVINVPAAQLVPILRPMVPQQGHLAAYAATNSLIITDRSSNIQRLMEIIRRVDKPDNEEIEVVRLNHAAAAEIVNTLTSLQRNNIGGPQGPGATQLVADERTNSILISGDRAVRVRMRGLIAHLDTPIQSGGNTRVVYLRFANAEDIVNILQGVSQGQAKVGTSPPAEGGGGIAQPTPAAQQQPANNGNVPPVQNQPPTQNNAVRPRSAAETGESNVDIQADPNTNSLIITAPPDEMQNILAVIRQLDIRRAQVLVEAVIAEITEDNTREFGINFLLDGSSNDVPVGFSNLGDATSEALGIAGALSTGTLPPSLGNGVSLALGRFGTGDVDFGFLVRAIASDADNNILSTPSVMTLDNEEAEIIVGQNVPFVTGTQLSANNNNPFQTIERQDIGLTLKVKPQINEGNSIKMELEQEVSGVNTTALTGASDITTSVRSIKTTVLVEDGQTIVLGGLIDDQIQEVEEKIPLLGDIPVIGNLFRYRSTQKSKQNLMIFLHPRIMRDGESASQFSNSKYNFLRSQQTLHRQEKENNIRNEDDLLPELRLFFKGQPIDSPLTQFDSPNQTSIDPAPTAKDIQKLALLNTNDLETAVGDKPSATEIPQTIESEPAAIDPVAPETASLETASPETANNDAVVASAANTALREVETDFVAIDKIPAKTPESEDQPDTLIGRVDDFSGETVAQLPTVSTVAPIPEPDTGALLPADNALIAQSQANTATEISSSAVLSDVTSPDPDFAPSGITGETASDANLQASEETESEPGTPETDGLIAMANIWQLGVNDLTWPEDVNQPVNQPEVEIVSITVVNAADHTTSGSPAVEPGAELGAVKIASPIERLPGAVAAKKSGNHNN